MNMFSLNFKSYIILKNADKLILNVICVINLLNLIVLVLKKKTKYKNFCKTIKNYTSFHKATVVVMKLNFCKLKNTEQERIYKMPQTCIFFNFRKKRFENRAMILYGCEILKVS